MESHRVLMQEVDKFINIDSDTKKVELDNFFVVYFVQSLIEKSALTENVKIPYFNRDLNFNSYIQSISTEITLEEVSKSITEGNVIAIYKGTLRSINVCVRKNYREVQQNIKESSFQGSLEEFVEEITLNIGLLRRYYPSSNLIIKETEVGELIKSRVAIIYDEEKVDKSSLNFIEKNISEVKAPVVQTLRELEQHIIKRQWLFPRVFITYRPDRVARLIAKGRTVILLNGTNGAGVAPVTFHEYFVAVDDYYLFPIPAFMLIILRYIAFFLSITLPSLYVAVTSYNPEIFRVQLALSITESRSGVTYPSYLEVLFMLAMIEFLIEASIRLPKTIGQAATTVGGLILGQAASQAQLVSNILIIIVAATAITNFCMPTTCISIPTRALKYVVLLFGSLAGLYGIFIALLALTVYAFSIYNFNIPYLNPLDAISVKNLRDFFRRTEL
ncbi:spore germination protein [Clostridium sp. BSD9I1]|uniref:spore germination protein n=1 Tax=Clostridium sp. BSD9I1 TaxID=2003589 RepID=UPI001644732F|nr:spore germination protein [Clostridium sp. BSD9I1]